MLDTNTEPIVPVSIGKDDEGKSTIKHLIRPLMQPFAEFFGLEAASGIVLLMSSVIALVLANSNDGVVRYFPQVGDSVLTISAGSIQFANSLSYWINDGLMALCF